MSDETHTYEQARARLEDIVAQVRRKDCSLEKSLDLLDEGVRLANICTEKCDHTQWRSAVEEVRSESGEEADTAGGSPGGEGDDEADQAEDDGPEGAGKDPGTA